MKGINLGSKNGNWKGGEKISKRGYKYILKKDHPRTSKRYIAEHILVMENYIKRFLTTDEVVHHINGNKLDNRIENLILYKNHSEHLLKGHINRKKGSQVKCNICGRKFYKRPSIIGKYNFCKQEHNRPSLWIWGHL